MSRNNDPRRQRPITINWHQRGLIGDLHVDGQFWGAIEWSQKRNAWCIEDAEGQCLAHEASIHDQAAAKNAAIELAKAMIRDGRMPSPEEARRLHAERDQIATQPTTIFMIMSAPTFGLGVADARAGRRYHADYDLWDIDKQWDYERGRMWAALAPRNLLLKRADGRIAPEAMRYFADEII